MKKTLLTLALAACTAAGAMADTYTLVFDGTNDMAGLTRQAVVPPTDFVKSITYSDAGIDMTLEAAGTGDGLALVSTTPYNGIQRAGIFVSANITPTITLKVPGGHITGATVCLAGYSLNNLSVSMNGVSSTPKAGDNLLYYWQYENANNGEELTITWAAIPFNMPSMQTYRYIHSIELTYTQDLGGKQDAGLAFSAESAQGFVGETFTAPELANPNNLPVIWSSSDDAIATVDAEGNVTLKSAGKAFITAATEGNDDFAAGSARYEITSIPVATNLVEMLEMAPASGNLVKVNCPLTVTYASGSNAYVIDDQDNAAYIHNTKNDEATGSAGTIYSAGNIIPAGWVATYTLIAPRSSVFYWSGLPADVTESTEVVYPEVSSITPADNNRVVTLMNVKFDTPTAYQDTKAYGTTPEGERYEFRDTFNVGQQPAGTYDVTGVVLYSTMGNTTYFYMAPIAYAESTNTGLDTVEVSDTDVRYFNMQGIETANPENGIFVKVAGGKASKVVVK